jgi:hypothetical protein
MATPVILYTSAGMPLGARAIITFYRPPVTTDTFGNSIASVVGVGAAATGTNLGNYVIEDLTLDLPGTLVERMGTYGEDRDKALVRKAPTLNMTAQMASAGTPTLCPGDYMEVNIGMEATSTASVPVPVPTTRWFLDGNSVSQNQNQANKFALKLQLDRDNSSASLKEF